MYNWIFCHIACRVTVSAAVYLRLFSKFGLYNSSLYQKCSAFLYGNQYLTNALHQNVHTLTEENYSRD